MEALQLASAPLVVDGGIALVRATGQFDLFTAKILADALAEACSRGLSVQLDMSAVTFMAASALAVILKAHEKLANRGCSIEIVRSAAVVKRLLRLTDMGWLERAEPCLN
ncbi:MAG: STAS domain-containing protein [Mycobacteriaceae bacterium]|nr:STAS domain-containing protein [Mycobacteriaceae bacterium]MBV9513830.1 STAS domain-containing protein [Mycobacteriaceae bacterium]